MKTSILLRASTDPIHLRPPAPNTNKFSWLGDLEGLDGRPRPEIYRRYSHGRSQKSLSWCTAQKLVITMVPLGISQPNKVVALVGMRKLEGYQSTIAQ